ncbi:hypothetical protein Ddye_018711 [Dipteronia dyeriana]|uniref:Uncharacterized protein n=1 Tax=Dipteronia dyeriana TaxID=168575 RepID=A0AAD9UBQ6_9ROSI|nr:hypothetical protein Ddye_018711 [Dipteronia dyeriana]
MPQRNRQWSFQFEPLWLKEDDIDRVVDDVWKFNGSLVSSHDFNGKLDHCAAKLTNWSVSHFKNLSNQIEIKNREIEHLYKSCEEASVMESIKALEVVVEGLQESEELYWKQCSKQIGWKRVTKNSKYFHAIASIRKKNNSIDKLLDCTR